MSTSNTPNTLPITLITRLLTHFSLQHAAIDYEDEAAIEAWYLAVSDTDEVTLRAEHAEAILRVAAAYDNDGVPTKARTNVGKPVLRSDGQRFTSSAEAARALGVHRTAVARVLIGEFPHVRGYTFTQE